MLSPKGQQAVQEPIVTEREGRYVIPVKVESRQDIKGIVHSLSNTGATAFVEPLATLELGNELRELTGEEQRVIEGILRDLSLGVAAYEAEIARSTVLAARLDLALAKAKYAASVKASEPIIINPGGMVNPRCPPTGERPSPVAGGQCGAPDRGYRA